MKHPFLRSEQFDLIIQLAEQEDIEPTNREALLGFIRGKRKEIKEILTQYRENNNGQINWGDFITEYRENLGLSKDISYESYNVFMQNILTSGDNFDYDSWLETMRDEQKRGMNGEISDNMDHLMYSGGGSDFHAISEVISNAIDATNPTNVVGRFGKGFFQIGRFLNEASNKVSVKSKKEGSSAYEISLFHKFRESGAKELYVSSGVSDESEQGTTVEVTTKLSTEGIDEIVLYITSKYRTNKGVSVFVNREKINNMEGFSRGGGEELAEQIGDVEILVSAEGIIIKDSGLGMNSEDISRKLLFPNDTSKERKEPSDNELPGLVAAETDFYWKRGESFAGRTSVCLNVGGTTIENLELNTTSNISDFVLELPSFTYLMESKDEIRATKEVILALKNALKKLDKGSLGIEEKTAVLEILVGIIAFIKKRETQDSVCGPYNMDKIFKDELDVLYASIESAGKTIISGDPLLMEALGMRKDIVFLSPDLEKVDVSKIPGVVELQSIRNSKRKFYMLEFDQDASISYVINNSGILIDSKFLESQENIDVINCLVNLNTHYEIADEKVFYGNIMFPINVTSKETILVDELDEDEIKFKDVLYPTIDLKYSELAAYHEEKTGVDISNSIHQGCALATFNDPTKNETDFVFAIFFWSKEEKIDTKTAMEMFDSLSVEQQFRLTQLTKMTELQSICGKIIELLIDVTSVTSREKIFNIIEGVGNYKTVDIFSIISQLGELDVLNYNAEFTLSDRKFSGYSIENGMITLFPYFEKKIYESLKENFSKEKGNYLSPNEYWYPDSSLGDNIFLQHPGYLATDFPKKIIKENMPDDEFVELKNKYLSEFGPKKMTVDEFKQVCSDEIGMDVYNFLMFLEHGGEFLKDQDLERGFESESQISMQLSELIYCNNLKKQDTEGAIKDGDFSGLVSGLKDIPLDLSIYKRKILSQIDGQDKSNQIWIREAVQNSVDALKAMDPDNLDSHSVDISFFQNNGNFVANIEDPVGMSFEHIFTHLLPIGKSSKNGEGTSGKFGQGFFSLLIGAKQLRLKTSTGDGQTCYVCLSPIYNKSGLIDDVDIRYDIVDEDFTGTKIERIDEDEGFEGNLSAMFGAGNINKYVGTVRDVAIKYNGNTVNQKIEDIGTIDIEGVGELRLSRAGNTERLTQNGLYISEIKDVYLEHLPDWIVEIIHERKINIELPGSLGLTSSRNALQDSDDVTKLQPYIYVLVMQYISKLAINGDIKIPMLPEDYIANKNYDFRMFLSGLGKVPEYANTVNNGEVLDASTMNILSGDRKTMALFLSYIEVQIGETTMSLNSIRRKIQEGHGVGNIGGRIGKQIQDANFKDAEILESEEEVDESSSPELITFREKIENQFGFLFQEILGDTKVQVKFHRGGSAIAHANIDFHMSFNIKHLENLNQDPVDFINIVTHELTHLYEFKFLNKWTTHEKDMESSDSFERIQRQILETYLRIISPIQKSV